MFSPVSTVVSCTNRLVTSSVTGTGLCLGWLFSDTSAPFLITQRLDLKTAEVNPNESGGGRSSIRGQSFTGEQALPKLHNQIHWEVQAILK